MRTDMIAQAMLFEILHNTRSCVQAVGAAARKKNPIHLLNGVQGIQKIGLAGAGGRPANVHTRDRSIVEEHHGTSRRTARVREMPDPKAANLNDTARKSLRLTTGRQVVST
jgi:hypothetical protein